MKTNLKSMFLYPENEYELKQTTMEDIQKSFLEGTALTGFVADVFRLKKEILVDLGGIYAIMPFDEASIYPIKYSPTNPNRDLPITIGSLIHSKVRVKIISFDRDSIIVSRKKNMIEAQEVIKDYQTVLCRVVSLKPHYLFCDIGDGITAFLHITEVTSKRINNISELFHKGETFSAKLLPSKDNRFFVSYKEMFKPYNPDDYKPGDVIQGVVKTNITDKIYGLGHFVLITPQVFGIMDITNSMPILHYGDKIEAVITKVTSKGPKLRFIKKI